MGNHMQRKLFLITGGSGFLGINLIRYLLKNGYRIRSLDIEPFAYPEQDIVDAVLGDIRDPHVVREAMRDVDIVVHTAAALPLYSNKEILSTDIEGARTLLDSAHKHNVERFIHISSTAVYGIPDHHPLLENDILDGVGAYGVAKIQAEKLCERYRQENNMCIPILRPKSFVGPERLGVFALFYDWAKDGHNFPLMGNGRNRYQLLDVEDLCEAIHLCATLDRDAVNDVFNIGAKEFTTMKEDYQAVLNEAGYGKKIRCFPATPMIWVLRLLELLHLSPLYKWVYETAAEDSFVSIAKAEKILEYAPKFSNKDALIRNYRWYLANEAKFAGTSGVNHRVPWKQGVLRLAKIFF